MKVLEPTLELTSTYLAVSNKLTVLWQGSARTLLRGEQRMRTVLRVMSLTYLREWWVGRPSFARMGRRKPAPPKHPRTLDPVASGEGGVGASQAGDRVHRLLYGFGANQLIGRYRLPQKVPIRRAGEW